MILQSKYSNRNRWNSHKSVQGHNDSLTSFSFLTVRSKDLNKNANTYFQLDKYDSIKANIVTQINEIPIKTVQDHETSMTLLAF